MEKKIKILTIEDNPGDAFLIEEELEEFINIPYELNNVGNLNEALIVLKKQLFDIIVLDLELPDSSGINTFLSVHNQYPMIPIIILTGLGDSKIKSDAIKKGAKEFLIKGNEENRLHKSIINCNSKDNKNSVSFLFKKDKQFSVKCPKTKLKIKY